MTWYKRVLNFDKQVLFLLSAEGSLVNIRAYVALHLVGTPSRETGTSPPHCLFLDNRLYMSPDSHMKVHGALFWSKRVSELPSQFRASS